MYGGAGYDYANSVAATPDAGWIVGGYTGNSFGTVKAAWVLKLDAGGMPIWQKAYSSGPDAIAAATVRPTSDGGYVVAGTRYSTPSDAWVAKVDASGSVAWAKTYGGAAGGGASSVQPTADGGYVVAGYTGSFGAGGSDAWILKLDAGGEIVWQNAYGGTADDSALSIEPTADDGYVVTGYTRSFGAGGSDAWVLKLDAGGGIVWQKTYGGVVDDTALSAQPTTDGGYVVAAYTFSYGAGNGDAWVLRLDGSGNVVWQSAYGAALNSVAYSVKPTTDGGYVIAGSTDSFSGPGNQQKAWIWKIDATGNVAWQTTYDGGSFGDAMSVQLTTDGGYIAAGQVWRGGFGPDALILKLDADGNIFGCGYMAKTSASRIAVSGSAAASAAIVTASTAIPAALALTASDSTAVISQECSYAATDIPTLSGSTLLLLSALLGSWGCWIAWQRGRCTRSLHT